jgi:hypothetical protein
MPIINNPQHVPVNSHLMELIHKISRKSLFVPYEYDVAGVCEVNVFLHGEQVGTLRVQGNADVYYLIGTPHHRAKRAGKPFQRVNESATTRLPAAVTLSLDMLVSPDADIAKKDHATTVFNYYNRIKNEAEMFVNSVTKLIVKERENLGLLRGVYIWEQQYAMHNVFCAALTGALDLKSYFSQVTDVDKYIKQHDLAFQYRQVGTVCQHSGVIVEYYPRGGFVRVYDLTEWSRTPRFGGGNPVGPKGNVWARVLYKNKEELPERIARPLSVLWAFGRDAPVVGTGAMINENLFYIEDKAVVTA